MKPQGPAAGSRRHRHAKGINLIELVKVIKIHRRTHAITGLSRDAQALLETRILQSDWYPHEPFLELLRLVHRVILNGSDEQAHEMGIIGGFVALQGPHRAFVQPNDAQGSVLAMRHVWRSYFDFGELRAAPDGPNAVRFELSGYPDMPSVHGMMIAGWAVAAGRLAGAPHTRMAPLECPWKGCDLFVYRVTV